MRGLCENCIHYGVCVVNSYCHEPCGYYEEERPHGKWVVLEYGYKCSVCTAAFYTHSNFCPNCGADMRTQNDRSWDTSERGVSGSVKNSIAQEEGEAE